MIAISPWLPAAHDDGFTFFDAIDGDGDAIMQGITIVVRPSSLPAHPIWPLRGPPTTDRIGRLSQSIGWDGAPNLTEAQASALRKLKKKVQKTSPMRRLRLPPLTSGRP